MHTRPARGPHPVLLAAYPANQHYFSLTPNQHQPPIIFSHNKSAQATIRSQQPTKQKSFNWQKYLFTKTQHSFARCSRQPGTQGPGAGNVELTGPGRPSVHVG